MSDQRGGEDQAHPLVRLAGWIKVGLFRELNPTERGVFTVYATFANKKGTAWPAAKTIGRLTGHSRQSVFGALRVLRRLKILEQVGRTTRKGMEALGAVGPMIYVVVEPPTALPEGFGLSVHAARTAGPLRVRATRTHSTSKGDDGRFVTGPSACGVTATMRAADMPECVSGASLSTRHAHRKGSEGDEETRGLKKQGDPPYIPPAPEIPRTRTGEGQDLDQEPLQELTLAATPNATRGMARETDGEMLDRLVRHFRLLGAPPTALQLDHLVGRGYTRKLIQKALATIAGPVKQDMPVATAAPFSLVTAPTGSGREVNTWRA